MDCPAHQVQIVKMMDLIFRGVTVLDCTGRDPRPGLDVEVAAGRITGIKSSSKAPKSRTPSIDGSGLTLMPGLTDAHVHLAMIGQAGGHGTGSWISRVLQVARVIEATLQEGFTTVRDAGGLEPAFAHAVRAGELRGPRILPSGSILSQTGGHGDLRGHYEAAHNESTIPGLVAMAEVVDGPDAVRKAAREQLRRGATQVKLFASGGILSPTDPFDSLQFSRDEMAAAVDVATSWGTYVLAHCHTSPAVNRALDAGVRSIEHGTLLDEATAERIAREDAFVVPTLQAPYELRSLGQGAGLTDEQHAQLDIVIGHLPSSVQLMRASRVRIGSGTDIVGPSQSNRGRELQLKAAIMGPHEAILSATRVNSELFGLASEIGTVEVGKMADVILVDGDPLSDISILGQPQRVRLVLLQGKVVKDLDGRTTPGLRN